MSEQRPESGRPGDADRPGESSAPGGPAMPVMPEEIGGYRITGIVGTGGMATVYAALQQSPRRTVALKVLRGEHADATSVMRLRREIEILGRLRHPGIAQVYTGGSFVDPQGVERPYFVMEYVEGARTITDFADQRGLDRRQRLMLFVRVCLAVNHGHANRVIHRDLKPSNILVDASGQPKVIDFGVARAAEIRVSEDTAVTEVGRLVGTIQYMAPEQVSRRPAELDARCDVYALGLILYKLLTGRGAFNLVGLPLYEAVRVIREDTPTRPGAIDPSLAGDLERIIGVALAKDPTDRYGTAGSLGGDIARFVENKPIRVREATLGYRVALARRRNRRLFTALRTALIVLLAGGAILTLALLMRGGDDPGGASPIAGTLPGIEEPGPGAIDRPSGDRAAAGGPRPGAGPGGADPERRPSPGSPIHPIVLRHHPGVIESMAFSADGRLLAASSSETGVSVYDLDRGEVVLRLEPADGVVPGALAIDAGGSIVLGPAADGVVLGATSDDPGAPPLRLETCGDPPLAIAVDRAGRRVAAACEDLVVRVVPAGGGEPIVLRGIAGTASALAFDDAGGLVGGGVRGGAAVWELSGGRRLARLPGDEARVVTIASWLEDGIVVAVDDTGTIHVWRDPATGAAGDWTERAARLDWAEIVPGLEGEFAAAAIATDQRIAAVGGNGRVGLWRIEEEVRWLGREVDAQGVIASVAITPDARQVAIGRPDGVILVAFFEDGLPTPRDRRGR